MLSEPTATPPKKGRPKLQAKVVPLHNLPGDTKEDKLSLLLGMWQGCEKCTLGAFRKHLTHSEIVFGDGNTSADVIIVGEAPGAEEVKGLVPFIGPSGRLLNQMLASVSDSPAIQAASAEFSDRSTRNRKDSEEAANLFHSRVFEWRADEFFITNAVCCQPPDDRQATNTELHECWERLWNTIYTVDPLLIVALGNTALQAVTRKQTVQITKMRGQLFDVEYQGKVGKLTYPVMPILPPSFLQRVADWKVKDGFFQRSIKDWRTTMGIVDFLRFYNFNTPIPKR